MQFEKTWDLQSDWLTIMWLKILEQNFCHVIKLDSQNRIWKSGSQGIVHYIPKKVISKNRLQPLKLRFFNFITRWSVTSSLPLSTVVPLQRYPAGRPKYLFEDIFSSTCTIFSYMYKNGRLRCFPCYEMKCYATDHKNGNYQKDEFLRNYILLTSKQLVLLRHQFHPISNQYHAER